MCIAMSLTVKCIGGGALGPMISFFALPVKTKNISDFFFVMDQLKILCKFKKI